MYRPIYSSRFEKEVKKFPKKEQIKILQKIESILENPLRDAIKLENTNPTIYRVRAGEYRVFFAIDNDNKIIKVTRAERRTTQTYR